MQTAYNGQAYCGAILYNQIGLSTNDSYREYIETPLIAPLLAGQTYQVSFRVSLAETSSFAIANIGDSRAYRLRDGHFERITRDHSWVQTLVDDGRITASG